MLAAPSSLMSSISPVRPGTVDIRHMETAADMRRFIEVPFRVHDGDPTWIPPLLAERRRFLDRGHNPYFEHADAAFWLASRDGHDVGRVSAQVDRRAQPGTGFFGMLSAIDDASVFADLLGTAERWLKARGVRRVCGPFSLSINHEAGLLVDGFATPPMLLMGHDRPWASRHLEALGYAKAKDLYAFGGSVTRELPKSMIRLLARAPTAGVVLRPLRMRNYREEVDALTDIFNDAWARNWGFLPLTHNEIDEMARQMRPLLHERLAWFAEIDGYPAGFAVCLPNLNEAIRDLGGRLWPFGWARLLWRLKATGVRSARLPLMGVRRRYASSVLGSKLAFMLIDAIRRECIRLGIETIEMSWILEDNRPLIRIVEALGADLYKTYRVYEKQL